MLVWNSNKILKEMIRLKVKMDSLWLNKTKMTTNPKKLLRHLKITLNLTNPNFKSPKTLISSPKSTSNPQTTQNQIRPSLKLNPAKTLWKVKAKAS